MTLPSRSGSVDSYRYGFQGQEKDDEIKGEGNSINYKFRMHDPRVGRFFAVDPLAMSYPYYTPYSFSGNKVIAFGEIEGLEEGWVIKGEKIIKVQGITQEVLNSFETKELAEAAFSIGLTTPKMMDSYMQLLEKGKEFPQTPYTKPADQVNCLCVDHQMQRDKYHYLGGRYSIGGNIGVGIVEAPSVILPEIAFAKLARAYQTWKASKIAQQTASKLNKVDGAAGGEFLDDFARTIDAPLELQATNITSVDDVVNSASAIKKGKTTRGVQALDKKINRGDEAYKGIKVNQENANKIIRDVMESKDRITLPTRNQQGIEVIDYFNPATKQGVRTIKETGEFDTFINYGG